MCAKTCTAAGYRISGTEYGKECWCNATLSAAATTSSGCTQSCSGDSTQKCGGPFALSVANDTTFVPVVARPSYSTWTLNACYADSAASRTFPNTITLGSNATVAACLDACRTAGYLYCGLEYYSECYGANVAPKAGLLIAGDPLAAGCSYPCKGNSSEACGGANRLLVYHNNGSGRTSLGRRHMVRGGFARH